MKKRTSIYIGNKIAPLIRKGDVSLSGRLGEVCERYDAILKKESPVELFEKRELQTLKRVFKPAASSVFGFPFILAEILSSEPGEQSILIEKLKYLTTPQTVSLIEHLEKVTGNG